MIDKELYDFYINYMTECEKKSQKECDKREPGKWYTGWKVVKTYKSFYQDDSRFTQIFTKDRKIIYYSGLTDFTKREDNGPAAVFVNYKCANDFFSRTCYWDRKNFTIIPVIYKKSHHCKLRFKDESLKIILTSELKYTPIGTELADIVITTTKEMNFNE